MEDKKLRIRSAYNYLRSKGIVHTQSDIAEKMGASRENISRIINGNEAYYTGSFLFRFNQAFDNVFNLNWLVTGEGDMLNVQSENILNIEEKGVPYFDDLQNANRILSINTMEGKPTFNIDYQHFNDCTAYIPIEGESMLPQYSLGEIVAVKRVYNLDAILWGEAHLVVTNSNANDMRTIKLIYPSEDKSKLILRASNPNYYGDTIISKEDIISLFIIKGKIRRNQL